MKNNPEQLDERGKRILRELIAHYCMTGEPVGSRTLSKKTKINLSPATVRNVLADLEEMGYIRQPHTSAGRIPTDKGYRFYVNNLLRHYGLNSGQKDWIKSRIENTAGNFQELLLLTTELLARLSHNVAISVTPDIEKMVIENVDFIAINSNRILAILVTRGGMISNKVIELTEPVTQDELIRMANYLRSEFAGLTLVAIRRRILDLMKQEQTQFDQLLKRAVMLTQKALDSTTHQDQIYIIGASQIVQYPEFFDDASRTRELLEALEHKSKILRVLTECIEGEGIHIRIGSENTDPHLQGVSLISSSYKYQDQPIGTLGILGPTRMEYHRVIPLVDHLAKVVTNILSVTD